MDRNVSELACVYAALILHDDDIAITSEKIQTILKAAKVEVDPYWPSLFSKLLEGISLKDIISNIVSGAQKVSSVSEVQNVSESAPQTATTVQKEEEKPKKEESEESDEDMGFGLFD